jgi:hypothetical protein
MDTLAPSVTLGVPKKSAPRMITGTGAEFTPRLGVMLKMVGGGTGVIVGVGDRVAVGVGVWGVDVGSLGLVVGTGVDVGGLVAVCVDVDVPVGVGVDVDVDVGVGVDVGVPVGVCVGVGVVRVALGEGVGTMATSWGVGVLVAAGGKVASGTTTADPAGVKMRPGSQGGGVITSGRSGSIRLSPVSRASSGFNSENILAGTCQTRSGVTAICAVIMRQTNPSSRIRRKISKLRRSPSLSRSSLEFPTATSLAFFGDTSAGAFPALMVLQRWKNYAERTADPFLAKDLDVSPVRLDNRPGHIQPQTKTPHVVCRHVRDPVEPGEEMLLAFR